jgi:hypothetical protein
VRGRISEHDKALNSEGGDFLSFSIGKPIIDWGYEINISS